jgi:hypothetical protein
MRTFSILLVIMTAIAVLGWWLQADPETPQPETQPHQLAATAQIQSAIDPVSQQDQASTPDVVGQFTAQLLTPPYSQPVTEANQAQTEDPVVASITVPLDDDIVWQLQLSQYRFSYPQAVHAVVTVKGEQPALIYYLLQDSDQKVYARGSLSAESDGLFSLDIPGQPDFPSELELHVESEPGHGALAKLSYIQPVAWLEKAGTLRAADTDLLIPLQLQIQKAGLYRVQAVLGLRQSLAKPLAILQGEFQLTTGSQQIELLAHHSVLPEQPFDAQLSQLKLELAPAYPGAETGYGRPLISAIALGDFNPQSLNRTPYQPDAQAQQSVQLLQHLSR